MDASQWTLIRVTKRSLKLLTPPSQAIATTKMSLGPNNRGQKAHTFQTAVNRADQLAEALVVSMDSCVHGSMLLVALHMISESFVWGRCRICA